MTAISCRQHSLFLICLLAWTAIPLLGAAATRPQPNIVFFLVDDMGWLDNSVPFHRSKSKRRDHYQTPNMEQMALAGTRFSEAYSCTVCTPSRVSLLTGKNASRHHVTNWTARGETSHESPQLLPPPWRKNGLQPADGPTLPQLLRKVGYRTIHIGKAHWGAYDTAGADPRNLGFDINIAGTAAGEPTSYQGIEGYDSSNTKNPLLPVARMPGMEFYRGKEIHLTDALTHAAIQQMEEVVREKKAPFFLHLAHYAIHTPIQIHRPFHTHYDNRKLSPTGIAYASMIEGVDASLGRIMQKIKELGIGEDTIVVFYSDNGHIQKGMLELDYPANDPPRLREGKGSAYEGGIRVPAMAMWLQWNPENRLQKLFPIARNAYCQRPILIEDWFPTILQWAGVSPPDDLLIDGEDLSPVLANPSKSIRKSPLIWHAPNVWTAYDATDNSGYQPHSIIRSGEWKAIYFYESERWELYQIRFDPRETNNLAQKESVRLLELATTLFERLQTMQSPWPVDKNSRKPRIMKLPPAPKKTATKLRAETFKKSLEPVGFVLQEKDWHIWCSAPLQDDQCNVHLYVSRWPIKDSFDKGWHTTSEIAHYRATSPVGPYRYVSTILTGTDEQNSWRAAAPHNPTALRLPDGRYALLFIANSNGAHEGGFPANQKIGLMTSTTPEGPWKLEGRDGLILDVPQDPNVWSHGSVVGVNNPTLLPMPDGRFFLYYKAMKPGKDQVRRMGLAIANQVEGPYRFEKEPLTSNKGMIEDGFAFRLDNDICLLVTDCHGEGFGGGMIYRSKDGIHFESQTFRAFEALDHYLPRWQNAAPGWVPWALQRPALLLGIDGIPSHLFAPCGTPPAGRQGTATFLFSINASKTGL